MSASTKAHQQLTVCFFGTSDNKRFKEFKLGKAIDKILQKVVNICEMEGLKSLRVITGGYQGLMHHVAFKAKQLSESNTKVIIRNLGIAVNIYRDPTGKKNDINKFGEANDRIFMSDDVGQRVQMMIELSDLFFVLPGSDGTLQELFQVSENLAHKPRYIYADKFWEKKIFLDDLYLDSLKALKAKETKITKRVDDCDSISNFLKENDYKKLLQPCGVTITENNFYQFKSKNNRDLLEELAKFLNHAIFPKRHLWIKNAEEQQCIISIDFAQIEKKKIENDLSSGTFDSFCTEEYLIVLGKFLDENNSIMLNPDFDVNSTISQWRTIINLNENISFTHPLSFPKPGTLNDQNKKPATFDDWCNHLEEHKMGRTAFWKSYEVPLQNKTTLNVSTFILFDITLPKALRNKLELIIDDAVSSVSLRFIESKFNSINESLRSASTRAAISQVMARNMSHNIGSHVSYRATNLEIKKRLEVLYPGINLKSDEIIAWVDLMSEKLDKYEIARNEYLADYEQSPKNLLFYRDVVLPFCENTLILDNIAASEHLGYEKNALCLNKLKIRCFIEGSEIKAKYPFLQPYSSAQCEGGVSYPEIFPYLTYPTGENDLYEALTQKYYPHSEDIEVTLHSEQAFYSILENIIRNSAKHNKDECQTNGLDIIVDIRTHDDDFYKVTIYDNVSQRPYETLYNEDKSGLGIYQRIKQSLLNESGQMRRENWGYADIRINAFLFKNYAGHLSDETLKDVLELVVIDDTKNFPNITAPHVTKTGNIRFGYQFKMCKPKKVLWIGRFENTEVISKEILEKGGVAFIDNLSKLESSFLNGISAFQFAIIVDAINEETLLEYKTKLPGRIIQANGAVGLPNIVYSSLSNILDKVDNAETLLINCYRTWLTQRIKKNINLFFHFEDPAFADKWDDVGLQDGFHFNTTKNIDGYELKKDQFNIIYDHHGKSKDKFVIKGIDFYTQSSIIEFQKGSYDQQPISHPPIRDKILLLYEIIDAATTNIFILDERILKVAESNVCSFKELGGVDLIDEINNYSKVWKMLAAGKVFVLTHLGNAGISHSKFCLKMKLNDDVSFETKVPRVTERLNGLRKDVLIIHRTYLDEKFTGYKIDDLIKLLCKEFGTVIITSGGGYPHNLNTDVKFVPFSIIEQFINLRLSKYRLNSIVQSATNI